MIKFLMAMVLVFPLVSFAKKPEAQPARKVAGVGVEEYQSQVCGSLNRVRYENQGKKGQVVKLLIDNINIKFYKKDVSYDDAVLASALTNKKIQVCYEPKSTSDSLQFLDFYAD